MIKMSSVIGKKPIVEYQSKDELLYDIAYYCKEIENNYQRKCLNKDEIINNVELIERALKKLMNKKRRWISNLRNNDCIRQRNNDDLGKKPIESKVGVLYDIECYCYNIRVDFEIEDHYSIGYYINKIKRALEKLGVF